MSDISEGRIVELENRMESLERKLEFLTLRVGQQMLRDLNVKPEVIENIFDYSKLKKK